MNCHTESDTNNNATEKWVMVKPKKNMIEKHATRQIKITSQFVKDSLQFLKRYGLRSVFLYGSVARGTNRLDSDIDILIIWEKKVSDNLEKIKNEIMKLFNRKVDLVSLLYKGKITFNCDDNNISQSESFLSNIITECVPIFGNTCDIVSSVYISKI